ncbi:hypothetical protein [Cellulomonas aerilata]|uniref:Uncharacterized protein n=1 Tax=Cellulomonas aerilata TaxID=515326 RepID=A0A512DAA0_9CELL|nr:hypothetical protein [Cellulomonas aerilata]GEO33307.1 hypothetical protein CAE01nite_10320 [Cellulomonas aerilata]
MSEPWEAEVFAVPDVAWQAHVPPARHPVPARYVPELLVGDEVTIGVPGHYFLDGQVVAQAGRQTRPQPDGSDEQDSLAVAAPYAFWLARAFPDVRMIVQWWPVARTWVYRDAVQPGGHPGHEASTGDLGGGSWLDHVRPTLHEPPVRRPRAARDAGSLTGRTLRLQHEPGGWSWWVAVSEPLDRGGDFVVQVMHPTHYWLAQAAFERPERARAVPLHRLFVYE